MASTIKKLAHLQIPLEDIIKATGNFHVDNLIGHGGFGPIYKGTLLRFAMSIKIAALRLDRKHGEGDIEFWTEISVLSDLKHTNLVSIIGFCDEKDEKIIITTYAAKGSLKEHLNNPSLTWTQRLKICLGVARALSYLHFDERRGYGVIHLNLNSSSILLDENWEPKLSGFKVSIKQSLDRMDRVYLCEPIGALGYVDPEIAKAKGVTRKSDSYSFGVVLFEILCGRRAYIKNDANVFLAKLAKRHYENETLQDIIHPDLRNQISPGSLRIYSRIAYLCLNEERGHRPHMLNIVDELEKSLKKALKFWPRYENFAKKLEHLKIQLDDIKLATHNFSDTYKTDFSRYFNWYKAELGHVDREKPYSIEGTSKSKLPKRHNTVEIKRFLPRDDEQEEELFFRELEIFTSVNHHNIVTLIGFCVEGYETIIVIENLSNGYLMDYFGNDKDTRILTWERRLKICIDVAHALSYLHSETEGKKIIIHSNINNAKFGIDENWRAKIDDFEWAITLPPNQEDEDLGKRTYFDSRYHVDPEYEKTGKLNRESDVYSFGVVLLEILCGRYADDQIYLKESEKGLVHVARQKLCMRTIEDIIDSALKEETNKKSSTTNRGVNKDSLHKFLEVANQCLEESQDQRPTMKVVLEELEKALFFQVNQEERVQQSEKDQLVDDLMIATREIPEEEVQHSSSEEELDLSSSREELEDLLSNGIEEEVQHLSIEEKLEDLSSSEEELEDFLSKEIVKKLENLKIRLNDIKLATNDFSKTYIIASWDGYALYRAELEYFDKENPSSVEGAGIVELPKRHNTVIIKRYPSKHHEQYGEEEFFTELEMLSIVKHPNITTLLGFCVEGSEMILVTENVSNGYLGDYLGNDNRHKHTLTWEERLKICIDVAQALKYIHSEIEDKDMIINCDIWSFNIGLDENWRAKIVHFWWSQFLPPDQEDEALYLNWIGRPSYTDPVYEETDKLKRESDIYSFGVVLLEILVGRLAYDPIYIKESDRGLVLAARQCFCTRTIEDLIDPAIKDELGENNFVLNRGPTKESLHTFIAIAHQCVAETQDERPTMIVVVKELEKALFFQKNNKDNPRISLLEINEATQNFDNNNCIGGGGFGKVYKGNLHDGDGLKTIVAKRLDTRFGQGEQQFLNELQILLEYKHENVIGLVGYCDEKNEKIIVYEYAPKGSLDRYLNDVSLTWVERLNISIDIANALDFFHGGVGKHAKVIHRDIKSSNILLSHEWKAKLADFGLSLISPLTQQTDYVIDHVCGTLGYLDPLYKKSGFLTIESDIYSLGVVLFEILCGKSTFEIKKHEGHYLPDFIKNKFEEEKHDKVVFKQIREQIVPKSLTIFQEVAYQCLHHEREKRPTTKKVLIQLKKALEFQTEHGINNHQVRSHANPT